MIDALGVWFSETHLISHFALANKMAEHLRPAFDAFRSRLLLAANTESGAELAKESARMASEVVRPLSHRLAQMQPPDAESWLSLQRVARQLHGQVQGILYASAMMFANSKTIDSKLINQIDHNLVHLLHQLEVGQQLQFDFSAALDSVFLVYQGMLEIEFEVRSPLQVHQFSHTQAGESVVELTREAIANAVKHSNAKTIRVLLSSAQGQVICVQVANDLHPQSGAADWQHSAPITAGFGTRLYNALCQSWRLEKLAGWWVFTALIRL